MKSRTVAEKKAIQARLVALGFALQRFGVDGDIRAGGETYAALEAFTRKHVPIDLGPDQKLSPGAEYDNAVDALMAMTVGPVEWSRARVTNSKRLASIHPDMIALAHEAAKGDVPFLVTDGIRTREQQAKLVASGASKTMNSYHLPWTDGLGYALDFAPTESEQLSYRWPLVYALMRVVVLSAQRLGTAPDMTWGAVWDRRISDLDAENLEDEVADYGARVRATGKKPFIDGPHIQRRRV